MARTGADAYAPEGEYSMVAHTDCGDIPMDDDYIGRPTLDLSPTTVDAACDGKFTVTPKGTLTYRGSSSDVEITSFYVSGDNSTRPVTGANRSTRTSVSFPHPQCQA